MPILLHGHPSHLELENAACRLTEVIQDAANKSIPHIKTGAKAKPWWTSELKTMRKSVTRAKRQQNSDFKTLRNQYFSAIKLAKQQHWNNFLESEQPENIYKAFRYTKDSFTSTLPEIQGNVTFEAKANCLREGLFPQPPRTESPSWASYHYDAEKWNWQKLQKDELNAACSAAAVKGKTPGPDCITQEIISHAYSAISDTFFLLFAELLENGYCPVIWRKSTGAVLTKPGKSSEVYSTPKGYRVIALLSCLGKISERILAKRLSLLAESTNLLHISQIGGRKQKSAIDAALVLTSELQASKHARLKSSCVFLDIKGAFDHVAKNRLLQSLIDLKMPKSLILWIESFLSQRALKLAFDNQIENDFASVNIGIPQGSPISPILFLIYIRELFTTCPNINQLSYIDDIALQISSTSIKKNVAILQRELQNLFIKGKDLQIEFDLKKTELIHFDSSDASLQLPTGDQIASSKSVKWLGVIFDTKLSFREHVAFRASKALAAFNRLARLTNTSRGLSTSATRNLYLACVSSVSDHGSQIWFTGRNPKSLLKPLQLLQNQALRRILGVFRTTPISAMEAEAGLLPVFSRFQLLNQQYYLRVLHLKKNHPVHLFLAKENEFQLLNQDVNTDSTQLSVIQSSIDVEDSIPSKSDLRTQIWHEWRSNSPVSYYTQHFAWNPRKKPFKVKEVNKAVTSAMYQLKFNHGYFKAYLHRINKIDNDSCKCGARETPEHLIKSCSIYTQQQRAMKEILNVRELSLPVIFNTQKGLQALAEYVKTTGISTRKWHLERTREEADSGEESGDDW